MPTGRPRHQVTETPDVAHAIDVAEKRWPGEPRSRLLVRLVRAGEVALAQEQRQRDTAHRDAVLASSGKYADAFDPDYLTELRNDWPA